MIKYKQNHTLKMGLAQLSYEPSSESIERNRITNVASELSKDKGIDEYFERIKQKTGMHPEIVRTSFFNFKGRNSNELGFHGYLVTSIVNDEKIFELQYTLWSNIYNDLPEIAEALAFLLEGSNETSEAESQENLTYFE